MMPGRQIVLDEQALVHLNDRERDCVRRYVTLLAEQLVANLVQVRLFGSAARGDMWPDGMPMRSDIDLLVLSREPAEEAVQQELGDETYPLFLECGRQIAPQFRTMAWFDAPGDERHHEFVARVRQEGIIIFAQSP
jgi:predicted nucleotidyltransferase